MTTPTLSEMIDKVLDEERIETLIEDWGERIDNGDYPSRRLPGMAPGFREGARAVGEPLAEALREAVEALTRYNNGGAWHRDTTILNANTSLEDIRSILEKAVGDA